MSAERVCRIVCSRFGAGSEGYGLNVSGRKSLRSLSVRDGKFCRNEDFTNPPFTKAQVSLRSCIAEGGISCAES